VQADAADDLADRDLGLRCAAPLLNDSAINAAKAAARKVLMV